MNCTTVQERLSSYLDNELPADAREATARHLNGCSTCESQRRAFQRLSTWVKELPQPEAPNVWAELERRLDAAIGEEHRMSPPAPWSGKRIASYDGGSSPAPPRRHGVGARAALQVAALVLLAVGVGYLVATNWLQHQHEKHMAAGFEHYLKAFQQDPQEAQQVLLASYPGRRIDPARATIGASYRPAVADLPAGYALDATYLIEMPCCQCVQTICKRADGSTLAIFEHEKRQTIRLGGDTCTTVQCNGKAIDVASMGEQVAASWVGNGRRITVFGARDVDEIAHLMSHIGRTTSGGS